MNNIIEDDYVDDENDELLNTDGEQCFLFYCDEILYAIPALSVNEIIEYQFITKVPLLNPCILGVTNLRGSIIGVVDLKERFKNTQTIVDKKTALIIVNIVFNKQIHNIALLVDEIYEVDGLDKDSITEVPTFGTKIKPFFLKSMARYNNKEVYLLNISQVLNINELSQLNIINDISEDDSLYKKEVKKKKITLLKDDEYIEDDEDDIDIQQLIYSSSSEINQYLIFEGPHTQYYASNVSKIEELLVIKDFNIQKNFDNSIIYGTVNIRGEMLPLVNFDKWLGLKEIEESLYKELIILNMGKHKFGLVVKSTEHILAIECKDMYKNSDADTKSTFIANIELNGKDTLCTIIDSDKILVDVFGSIEDKSDIDIDNIEKMVSTKKIFFADDSGLVRNSVKRMATKLNLKYSIFDNGKLLYEELENSDVTQIGLIVTDLEMPVMDGKKLISKIKKDNNLKDINIIVYTNMSNTILESQLLKLGASKVINKLDVKSLSEAIREFI